MKTYDAIVIGAGQAGGPLAKKLASAGKKTVLIEKRFYGGTCVNDGCTPTKTMVASAKAAYMAAGKSAELGVPVDGFSVNMPQIKKRKDEIVLKSRNGGLRAAEKTENLDVLLGEATFTGDKTIEVTLHNGEKHVLQADLVFLNPGELPTIPDIEGLHEIDYLNSTTILDLDYVPDHLLVLGGNYVGLEFGQMFRRFGSKVTIIERSARIVAHEDEDISEEMQKILEAEAIHIHYNTQATKFKQKDGGKITVTITTGGKDHEISCSHVLVAVGRTPQTAALNLQKTGVTTDGHGHIPVNDKLETNVPGIYALGDVNGGPAFTHISYNDYTIVYRNLIKNQNLSTNNRLLPYCMFTDPQLGRIGISESEAKAKNINYKLVKMPMAYVARAIETGDTRGFMKALVDPETKKILGAAVLGAEGGEIMTVLQMAMEGGITYDRIKYFIFAHPLYAESLNNLFMSLED